MYIKLILKPMIVFLVLQTLCVRTCWFCTYSIYYNACNIICASIQTLYQEIMEHQLLFSCDSAEKKVELYIQGYFY